MSNIGEITPGILFLDKFDENIVIKNKPNMLKGTFLIHFINISIEIQGKSFHNEQKITSEPLSAILHPSFRSNIIEEVLSLQMLNQLNTNNTKHISP